METNNFFQVVPGTEHFASIDMIIEYVKQCGTDGLIEVLENTKKFGIELKQGDVFNSNHIVVNPLYACPNCGNRYDNYELAMYCCYK